MANPWFWPVMSLIANAGVTAAGQFKGPVAQPGRAEPGSARQVMQRLQSGGPTEMMQQMANMQAEASSGGPLTSTQGPTATPGQAPAGGGIKEMLSKGMQGSGGQNAATPYGPSPSSTPQGLKYAAPRGSEGVRGLGSSSPNKGGNFNAASAANTTANIAGALASLAGNTRGESAQAPGVRLGTVQGLSPSIDRTRGNMDLNQLIQLLAQTSNRQRRF